MYVREPKLASTLRNDSIIPEKNRHCSRVSQTDGFAVAYSERLLRNTR